MGIAGRPSGGEEAEGEDSERSVSNISARRWSTAALWLAIVKALEWRGSGGEENCSTIRDLLVHRAKYEGHGPLHCLQNQLQLVLRHSVNAKDADGD